MLLLVGACGEETVEPAFIFDGLFPLVAFDGVPLPADIGSIPTRDGTPSGCNLTVTSGSLLLVSETSAWKIDYEAHNSCTGEVLSRAHFVGEYIVDGNTISFAVAPVDEGIVWTGTVTGSRIQVNNLTFGRP